MSLYKSALRLGMPLLSLSPPAPPRLPCLPAIWSLPPCFPWAPFVSAPDFGPPPCCWRPPFPFAVCPLESRLTPRRPSPRLLPAPGDEPPDEDFDAREER